MSSNVLDTIQVALLVLIIAALTIRLLVILVSPQVLGVIVMAILLYLLIDRQIWFQAFSHIQPVLTPVLTLAVLVVALGLIAGVRSKK